MADGSFELEFSAAFAQGLREKEEKEKKIYEARIKAEEERAKKERELKNIVWEKYFPSVRDEKNRSSLQDALIKSAKAGARVLYFNFDRSDFSGWHNIVVGGYKNAHPAKLLGDLLNSAKREGFIPSRVSWDIWNNGAFTVVFDW